MDEVENLILSLRDGKVQTRRDAAYLLGEKGDDRAIPALSQALQDNDRFVRARARDSLRQLKVPVAAEEDDGTTVVKATFWRRWLAFTIDMAILSLADSFILGMGGNEATPAWWGVALGIISIAIPAIYWIWPYSTGGQTAGKTILGVKVVSIDGSPLNWHKGTLRSVGYILSSIPFNLGFLWSIWDVDEQAWHDKIAGTCVVRATVAREQLQGTIDPMEARQRQKKWLLGLGIPALLIVVLGGAWVFSSFQSGMVEVKEMGPWPGPEVKEMGPWPGPEVSPREVVAVDLSHLGLRTGQIQNARDEEMWAGGQYNEGILFTYEVGKKTVVAIWGLRYDDRETAGNDFDSAVVWAEESCQVHTWTRFSETGVIHCGWSDSYDKIFLNDYWIVDILALEGTEFTPVVLVDKVRDAIAAHWEGIAQP